MSSKEKHLWEVDHPYYCSEENYYAPRDHTFSAYESWHCFHFEWGDANLDHNLVFRWDWREGEGWGLPEYNGDDYYRNGKLMIHMINQRMGIYLCHSIDVCRADEPAVIEYLKPRLKRLAELWQPIGVFSAEG